MFVSTVFYRLCRFILEVSSIPLAFLLYLMLLSGYGLIKPYAVEKVTLGLLNYATCVQIHTSPTIRLALVFLAILHGFTGFQLMVLRVKNRYVRLVLKTMLWLTMLTIVVQILIIELT